MTVIPSSRGWIRIGWVFILASLIGAVYASVLGIAFWLIAASVAAIFLLPASKLRMRAVDWAALLIAALEIPSVVLSQYRSNSVRASSIVALSLLVYFVVRLTIRTSQQTAALAGLLGVGAAWVAYSGPHQFIANAKRLGSAGLTDLVAFRATLMSPPAPWVLGEWFTLLLLAMPFACALPTYLWQTKRRPLAVVAITAPLLIAAALTVSLSRAVFGSVILFCLTVCILIVWSKVVSIRKGSVVMALSLGALVLILACIYPLYPGVVGAYTGRHTSQVRSGQGRIEIWSRSLELVGAHPFWGVGSSNAGLFLLSTADQDETTGFASRTFSLPVQVLVEKGSIGLLLYTLFLILVGREFYLTVRSSRQQAPTIEAVASKRGSRLRKMSPGSSAADQAWAQTAMQCCFAAGLVAVLYRELTYSSVMEHTLTLVLVATLSALLCSPERA